MNKEVCVYQASREEKRDKQRQPTNPENSSSNGAAVAGTLTNKKAELVVRQ